MEFCYGSPREQIQQIFKNHHFTVIILIIWAKIINGHIGLKFDGGWYLHGITERPAYYLLVPKEIRVTLQSRNLADTSSKWSMLISVIMRQTDFRYLLMWFTEKDIVIRYSVLSTKAYNLNWVMGKQSDKPKLKNIMKAISLYSPKWQCHRRNTKAEMFLQIKGLV